jgi:catechol 2,3-dioxygenase-like lactoylglutathione lyase family enzyme
MPPLHGVLETALYVRDLDVSESFYRSLFGFPVLISDERMRALKITDTQILLLFVLGGSTSGEKTPGGFIPPHDGRGQLHFALCVENKDIGAWRKYLQEHGVEIESEVQANGGHSIYFRDPDGHCVELGTPQLWSVS